MEVSAPTPGATHLATKVELTISCNNLMDMDVFSKSDPLCALYINTSGSHWHEVCTRLLEKPTLYYSCSHVSLCSFSLAAPR